MLDQVSKTPMLALWVQFTTRQESTYKALILHSNVAFESACFCLYETGANKITNYISDVLELCIFSLEPSTKTWKLNLLILYAIIILAIYLNDTVTITE